MFKICLCIELKSTISIMSFSLAVVQYKPGQYENLPYSVPYKNNINN